MHLRRPLLALVIAGALADACVYDVPPLAADGALDASDAGTGLTESGLPCTCVDPIPSGFTAVEFALGFGAVAQVCTNGYDGSTDYITGPVPTGADCSCTCAAATSTPVCSCGPDPATFQINYGPAGCNKSSVNIEANLFDGGGGCYTTSQNISTTTLFGYVGDIVPAIPCTANGTATCPSTATPTGVTAPIATQGRACATDPLTRGSCAPSQVCFPATTTPFSQCIVSATAATCPAAYTKGYRIGSAIVDTRSCAGSCGSCGLVDAGTCGPPTLDLWTSNANCTGFAGFALTETACKNLMWGTAQSFGSARYRDTFTGATCGATSTLSEDGGLDVASPLLMCCL